MPTDNLMFAQQPSVHEGNKSMGFVLRSDYAQFCQIMTKMEKHRNDSQKFRGFRVNGEEQGDIGV